MTVKVLTPLKIEFKIVLQLEVGELIKRVEAADVNIADDLLVLAEEEHSLGALPLAAPLIHGG